MLRIRDVPIDSLYRRSDTGAFCQRLSQDIHCEVEWLGSIHKWMPKVGTTRKLPPQELDVEAELMNDLPPTTLL